MKRAGYIRKAKPGELKMRWGYSKNDGEDMFYIRGDGCGKSDGALLHYVLGCERWSPTQKNYVPSLIDELKSRGYDIKTFRLFVRKAK